MTPAPYTEDASSQIPAPPPLTGETRVKAEK